MRRVRVIVANIKENMKVYRPKHSWLSAFTAFRLPSPLSASDEAGRSAREEVWASLNRICEAAQLPEEQACFELTKLLPRAEKIPSGRLQHSCCLGALGSSVARISERPPPGGALPHLENFDW